MENYTAVLRKKIICKYCHADSCSKCIERYLLDRIEDAHCLHCRVNYNDTTLREICTKTYLQHVYFKHRQEVLVNRERANLPGLQEQALQEKQSRLDAERIKEIRNEMMPILMERDRILNEYNTLYGESLTIKDGIETIRARMDALLTKNNELREKIQAKNDDIVKIRYPVRVNGVGNVEQTAKDEEKKKFIRRCTRDGCQGFLSTAWKCGLCEYYSCNKCFKVKTKKHDDPHECRKEDIETADLIKKDAKPCPNCGEFISRVSGCSQMFCITCQTPWDWVSGKVVTSGVIHNPHYYEWLKHNGHNLPRNPADVPCGGFPNAWELRRMPRNINQKIAQKFYEFHRMCGELQDISARTYRSHIDTNLSTKTNIGFLLGDYDDKRWGMHLAKNERKKKRDAEVQEVLGAFRLVAVELINRVQNFNANNRTAVTADGRVVPMTFSLLPVHEAEKIIEELDVEIQAFIKLINDGLRSISINYNYSVPCIELTFGYYCIYTKNWTKKSSDEAKKNTGDSDDDSVPANAGANAGAGVATNAGAGVANAVANAGAGVALDTDAEFNDIENAFANEDTVLQAAIEASLRQK